MGEGTKKVLKKTPWTPDKWSYSPPAVDLLVDGDGIHSAIYLPKRGACHDAANCFSIFPWQENVSQILLMFGFTYTDRGLVNLASIDAERAYQSALRAAGHIASTLDVCVRVAYRVENEVAQPLSFHKSCAVYLESVEI